MSALSFVFYCLAYHPVLVMIAALVGTVAITLFRALRRGGSRGLIFALVVFVVGMINVFTGQFLNAAFLNAVGTRGEGVITDAQETSSRLNDMPVWRYEAVVRTQDGPDQRARFSTLSATLWPIRNEILVPPLGERFAAKFVPGFARNFVILTDETPSGRRRLLAEWRAPVDIAERRLRASPANREFRTEYRKALTLFLREHADADPALTAEFQARLAELNASRPE